MMALIKIGHLKYPFTCASTKKSTLFFARIASLLSSSVLSNSLRLSSTCCRRSKSLKKKSKNQQELLEIRGNNFSAGMFEICCNY